MYHKSGIMPIIFLLLAVISGCDDNLGFDEGDPVTDQNIRNQPATLQTIQNRIFTPSCASCHSGNNPPQGLLLDTEQNSFNSLVGRPATQRSDLQRVQAGNPNNSYLIWKLEGNANITGNRMPPNGQALSADSIGLIRDWIANGAQSTDSTGVIGTNMNTQATDAFGNPLPIGSAQSSSGTGAVTPPSGYAVPVARLSNFQAFKNQQSDTLTFQLRFSVPLDPTTLDRDTILVYTRDEGSEESEYALLDYAYYDMGFTDDKNVEINVELPRSEIRWVKIVLNDSRIASVLDANGNMLDGDSDTSTQGGIFEYEYEIEGTGADSADDQ